MKEAHKFCVPLYDMISTTSIVVIGALCNFIKNINGIKNIHKTINVKKRRLIYGIFVNFS